MTERGIIDLEIRHSFTNVKIPKPYFRLILLFLLVGLTWSPVFAASNLEVILDSVMVDLWPEYDQPSVLVIYEIELASSMTYPQVLTFQVPVNAEVQTVASRDEEGHLVPLEWEVSGTGQWLDIQFTTQTSEVRLEYYDPNIIKQDDQRSFNFMWSSFYTVNDLSIYIQQPYGAGELTTDPGMTQVSTSASKSTYYMLDVGAVDAGIPYELNFSYTKDTSNLAYPALSVSAASPINRNTAGRAASILSVVLGLLVIATAVLLIIGIYYVRFRKKTNSRIMDGGQDGVVVNPDQEAVFCHECGSRSRAGDSYCRNCGTELRRFN
jgi:hypothetical protein